MKKSVISLVIVAIVLFAACRKSGMMDDNSLNVDIAKYETILNLDYTQANQYHNALGTKSAYSNDIPYNKMMFNKNDSLFSEHFYEFCIDMMKNGGMMSGSNGMMGNNSNMMGSGGMMNGGTMGSMQDINKMIAFMDSLNLSGRNMMNRNFCKTDSLYFNQLNMCKMMTTQTKGVGNIYTKMQTLRKNHKLIK